MFCHSYARHATHNVHSELHIDLHEKLTDSDKLRRGMFDPVCPRACYVTIRLYVVDVRSANDLARAPPGNEPSIIG